MNKYIIIAIVLLVLLGGGFYLYSNKTGSSMPYSQNSDDTSVGSKMSGKIADLLSSGKNLECTFSSEADGYKSAGTMFVSGANMRGDFKSEVEGKMMDSHMIQKGETMYSWTTDPKQGMMMTISKEDQEKYKNETKEGVGSESFDMVNKDYDYDCKNWTGDLSKFTPPSDIVFQDLSKMMEKVNNPAMMQKDAPSCSVCDSLEGEAKDSCKKALSC